MASKIYSLLSEEFIIPAVSVIGCAVAAVAIHEVFQKPSHSKATPKANMFTNFSQHEGTIATPPIRHQGV
jgi:hypothetical protein